VGSPSSAPSSGPVLSPGGHEPANLGDVLDRVLDRGIVIVGDIRVSLLDIELLTLKLRLVVASLDTAREVGIDWWEHDPWLTSRAARPPVERGPSDRREVEPQRRESRAARAIYVPPEPEGQGDAREEHR
jgi:Gas vesicle protein